MGIADKTISLSFGLSPRRAAKRCHEPGFKSCCDSESRTVGKDIPGQGTAPCQIGFADFEKALAGDRRLGGARHDWRWRNCALTDLQNGRSAEKARYKADIPIAIR